MKIDKKMALISAVLLTVSPVLTSVVQPTVMTVQAATKNKNTITVPGNAALYNSKGDMLTTYNGKTFTTFNKTTNLKVYGNPVKIRGNYYYYIGNGAYAAANYVSKINGREALSLNCNSYVYTKKGNRTGKLLRKNLSYIFTGKYKQNDTADNNVFTKGKKQYQLISTGIKGNDYFQIGKNQYIRIANIERISTNALTHNEIKVTIKKNTHVLLEGADGRIVYSDKIMKKGRKFISDALVGLNNGSNSTPMAYRIKGTHTYIWKSDAYSRHFLTTEITSSAEFNTYTVRAPKDGLQFYNANGENITPTGASFEKHRLLGVDGQMYIWVPKENKAELFYHIVATQKEFITPGDIKGHYNSKNINIGNAFVKVADTENYSGLKKPEIINTAAEAKTDAEKSASSSQLDELKSLLNDSTVIKKSTAYKLSNSSTRNNYDVTVQEVQALLKSKRNLSAAEVKLYSWILQTRTNNLYGKKITVKNMKKMTKTEINLLQSLLNEVESNVNTKSNTYTTLSYDKKMNKVYLVTTAVGTGKLISKVEQPLSDFVTEE